MKSKLLSLLITTLAFSSIAAASKPACTSGYIDSAWPLLENRGTTFNVLVVIGESPRYTKSYSIDSIYSPALGTGRVSSSWTLRPDMYGPEAISVMARFGNLEKAFQIAQKQRVCIYVNANNQILEFIK